MPDLALPGSLAAFEGRWRLDRVIRQADGPEGRLKGHATFTRGGPGTLVCDEEGEMQLGTAPPLRATRRYLWRSGGGGIEVSFDDNRPFHGFTLGVAAPTAIHICPPDRYEVAYDFADWPIWRATWTVEGPRKAYVMTSRYARD